ncbi:uncharacterized protein YALI1_F08603g [Yarrowia lipolytica]|uniref:Uncharacterized protein n=1 Tax=Yarrowia lipolytica TaxID=4952 RepID=A0A1D8NM57_YARLL|nr:hypothetical protein YALI1_F08603g [Yarrowia lipolytica]
MHQNKEQTIPVYAHTTGTRHKGPSPGTRHNLEVEEVHAKAKVEDSVIHSELLEGCEVLITSAPTRLLAYSPTRLLAYSSTRLLIYSSTRLVYSPTRLLY